MSDDVSGNTSSSSSTDNSSNTFDECKSSYISIAHYNVQNLLPKLAIIMAELLNDLIFDNYHPPFFNSRTDRIGGGVAVYVNKTISVIRRTDLELRGLESIWVQLNIKHHNLLLGTFYRPLSPEQRYGTDLIIDRTCSEL